MAVDVRLPLLERPLVLLPVDPAGSPGGSASSHTPRGRVLQLETRVRRALGSRRGDEAEMPLHALRFEAYRAASTTWEDPWWLGRVAGVEELQAELARQQAAWTTAWAHWRAGWWVRQLLAEDGGRPQRRRAVWSTAVMGALHVSVGRTDDARKRLSQAVEAWTDLELDPAVGDELAAALAQLDRA